MTAALAFVLGAVPNANATVDGTAPSLLQSFRVFGNSLSVGNSLMQAQPSQPLVNSLLLSSSTAQVSGVPRGATIEGAFLFWSGSTDIGSGVDRTVSFGTPNGASRAVSADLCFEATGELGPPPQGDVDFFYCRADVTDVVAAGGTPTSSNGIYTVGQMQAEAGVLDAAGQCINPFCQAFYGGWSMVLVWSSDDETTLRDVVLFDGFRLLDETTTSTGVDRFSIGGFDVADPPEATYRFFALEGDALLGVPPQDTDPVFNCTTCFDYAEFNGEKLSDPLNQQNNLFNATIPQGIAIGVDIDSYDVSALVSPGDTSVTIEVGSGDDNTATGHANNAGGGELFFLGYNVLTINRLAPSFRSRNTFLAVDPTTASPGEVLFYTLQVTNDGSLDATNVDVSAFLPPNTEYVTGSTVVDGVAVADVGGTSPLFSGLGLGTIASDGDNQRRITFRLRVADDAPNGSVIRLSVEIDARELDEPTDTNETEVTVVAPTLQNPEKSALDLNGGTVQPGDFITYTVRFRKDADTTAAGLTFVDDISAFAVLTSVNAGAFVDASDLAGGANGTGLVRIESIVLPSGVSSSTVTYTVRIKTTAELTADGVAPEDIDGLLVRNQGALQAAFLPAPLLTDDPGTGASPDPTDIRVSASVNFNNPSTFKRAEDRNGGQLEPGDPVRFTISVRNSGSQDATIDLVDPLPLGLTGASLVSPVAGVTFLPAPAGVNGTGLLEAFGLLVPAGTTITIRIDATVDPAATGGTTIQNIADLTVVGFPDQDQRLTSGALTVVAGPSFADATKVAEGAAGGFEPGDVVTYRLQFSNDGNADATGVVVTDIVSSDLTAVTPADGGVFDAGTRTIRWDVGNVPVGQVEQLSFTARIGVAVPNGTRISNQAQVGSDAGVLFPTDDPSTARADDATDIVVAALPALRIEKIAIDGNGGAFEPGDRVTYQLTVTNDGRADAVDVAIVDDVPAQLSDLVPNAGGALVGQRVTWSSITTPALAIVTPGEAVILTVTGLLAPDVSDGTVIGNQAVWSSDDGASGFSDDPGTAAVDDPTNIVISAAADLTASTKVVEDLNGGAPQPGDRIRYTIELSNRGSGGARDLVVIDTIPANLIDVVALDGGVVSGADVLWTPAAVLLPGDTLQLRFEATIVGGLTDGTVIANQARVQSSDIVGEVLTDDPDTPAVDDPTAFTVVSAPDFATTTKTVSLVGGGLEFTPGSRVLYEIEVRNTGTERGENVLVIDAVDTGSLVDIQPLDGGTFVGGEVRWTLGTLEPDTGVIVRFEATVVFPLPDGTPVANQANVFADDVAATPSDDPATDVDDDATVFSVVSRPDLSVSTKTFVDSDGGAVRPGDEVVYTILVRNSGSEDALDVVVTDVVDGNLTVTDPGDAIFDAVSGTLIWNSATNAGLARVEAGDATVVTLQFTAVVAADLPNGTIVSNQASLDAAGLAFVTDDPSTADASDPTAFPVISSFDFSNTTKAVLSPAGDPRPGGEVVWQIIVENSGDATATNVVVEDTLDPSLSFVSASPAAQLAAGTLRWTAATAPELAAIAPGASVTLTLTTVLDAPLDDGTLVQNQALVNADGGADPFASDDPTTAATDDATVVTVDASPSLAATEKTVVDLDGDGFFEPGDEVEYTILVRNDGDAIVRDASVVDRVPVESLSGVVALDGGRFDGTRITWSAADNAALASVAPGTTGVPLRFRATIRPDATDATVVSNQAQASAPDVPDALSDDPTTAAADDATNFTVTASARLDDFTKVVVDLDGGELLTGDRVEIRLQIQNDGTQPANNVIVTDPLPAGFVDIAPADGGTEAGGVVSWPPFTLAAGENRTLRFEATAEGDDGALVSNQAIASAPGVPDVLSDDPATPDIDDPTVIQLTALAELTLEKSFDDLNGGFIERGDDIRYTLTLTNVGSGPANNVEVRDAIQAGVFASATPGQGGQLVDSNVVWNSAGTPQLASLAPGESALLTLDAVILATVDNGTLVTNQATARDQRDVSAVSDDPALPGEADPTEFTVLFPELDQATKTVTDLNGEPVEAGDVLEYSIRIDAGDGVPLTNVSGIDAIDPRLTNITLVTGGTYDEASNQIAWNAANEPALARVEPGGQAVLVFRATVAEGTEIGAVINNQVVLNATEEPDGVLTDDPTTPELNDPTAVTVNGESLTLFDESIKEVTDLNGGFVEPGDTLRYRIVVFNSGTQTSSGTQVLDVAPALTAFVPGSLIVDGVAGGDPSALAAGLSLRDLPAGQSLELSVDVVVADDAPEGARISNQAFVSDESGASSPTDDPTTDAVDDATTVFVGEAPNLSFSTKRATTRDENGDGVAQVGETLAYEIVVENRGTADANGVTLVDSLPDNTLYVAGTLARNGIPITDDPGNDAGEVVDGVVSMRLGRLVPGQQTVVSFELVPVSGTLVVNQAEIAFDGGAELSDADGDPRNGAQATVTALGDSDGALRVSKTVADANGGTFEPGDELLYVVTIEALTDTTGDIDVTDVPDAQVLLLDVAAETPGVEVLLSPPAFATLRVAPMEAGERREIVLRAVVSDGAVPGEVLCNQLQLADTDGIAEPPACFTVGGRDGAASLDGLLFRETGTRDGLPGAETDEPVSGFVITITPSGFTTPIATVESDELGSYAFDTLAPGSYDLAYYAGSPDDGGALFGEQPLEIVAGATERRDLLVDPSGVLYEVTSASPVGGARVFLYYDEGEGDAGLGELVDDADLASATQQGQRVPASGFYRFDARTDASYRIVVEPGNSGLSFPSLQLPPQEAPLVATTRVDVVPQTNPADVEEDARTYATRIELSGPDAGVFNNHIPLDPLSDQISLVKRADRPVAYVGDIVTYTITAENRSSAELVFDAATATGGVVLVDELPNGFRVVEGSAVATLEREDGLRAETLAVSVTGARSLRFEQTDGGATRPLSLPAGARMTLRYFAVLGSNVEPGDTYRNTAQLLQADTEFALSRVAHVDVRVEYDPVFDQGTLLGKVYCDDNGDGRQQRGERGLPGARVYLDTGFYTDVDSDGQFHFSAIDPGLHLLKIDMHTLPVGSTLTTEETRAFNVTRGLPVGIDFGVTCPDFSVDDIDVTPGDGALAEAERRRRERYVQLEVDVNAGSATLEGELLPLLSIGTAFGAGTAQAPQVAPVSWMETRGSGTIDSTNLRTVLRRQQRDIQRCYVEALADDETLRGRINLQFTIAADGTVSDVRFPENELGDGVGGCVAERVREWVFEPPVGGTVTVRRPYLLELEGGGEISASQTGDGAEAEGSGDAVENDTEATVALVDAPEPAASAPPAGEPLAVIDLRADVDGALVEPLAVALATNAEISSWVLEVERAADGQTVYLREGREWPEGGVTWDGQNDREEMVLEPDGVYVARVRAMDNASRYAEGAAVVVRVARTRERFLLNERITDAQFDERRLDPAIADALRAMAPRLQATAPNIIRIEAHVDDRDNERDAEAVTRSQAIAAARFMVNELGIDRDRIEPEGYGVSRPIYPNVGDRTRQSNRRLDVRVVDPESEIIVPELPPVPTPVARVVANRRALATDGAGRLDELLPIPVDGWVAITMQRPDGTAQGIMTQVRPAEVADVSVARATLAEVPVTLSLTTSALDIGGSTQQLAGLASTLSVSATEVEVRGARIAPALTFEPSGLPGATSWRFEVSQPGVGLVWSESGEGDVPRRFNWQGRTSDGAGVGNGRHIARVSVRTASGGLITTAPASFWVGEPAEELDSEPTVVRINGEMLSVSGDELRATVRSATGRRVLIDVQAGARVIVAVAVPEGFAATSSRALDLSGFRLGVAPTTASTAEEGEQPESSGPIAPASEPTTNTSDAADTGDEAESADAASEETPSESPEQTAPPAEEAPAEQPPETPAVEPDAEPRPSSPFRPATSSNPMQYLSPSAAPAISLDLVAQAEPAGFGRVGADGDAAEEAGEEAPMPSYDELTAFYERELAASLSTDLESELQRIANEAPAGQIDVQLPPPGVAVPSPRLPVQGTTAVGNRVLVNGSEVDVDDDGRFATVVTLPAGPTEVVVETVDTDGNRGRLEWPVEVNRSAFFLMALADTAVGTSNAEIAGAHDHNSRRTGGGALLYGQARLYFKGWVSGEEILSGQFDDIEMTAHVDTGARREFQSFTRETIQPDRDYPVFGDGSEAVSDVNTSGKVYVLLQADESHATWGNFNSQIQGVELLRYERNLYGAQVVLDEVFAEEFDTELRIHVADEEEQVRQTFNYLRGTGGSIYYLQDRPVVEGSERVSVIVRDRISGIELSRTPLSRNADYSMRYSEGRIITRAPVPSVVDDTFIIGNTGTTRSVLRGNPVYIEVTYDQETTGRASDVSYGVHARETFYDLFTVGGGIVEEGDTNDGGYSLWGVEAGFGPTETTRIDVEYAASESDDLQYSYSDDGGLTFGRFRVDDTADDRGSAILVRGRFEIADVIESERGKIWNVDAYYQETDRGFFSNGTILDQGEQRYGVASQWAINERHGLSLRHDRVETSVDDFETDALDDTVLLERQVTVAQYDYQMEPGTLSLSYQHSFVDDERIDDGYENDIVAAAIGARILPWLRLGIEQELVIRGEDPRLTRGAQGPGSQRIEDRFITTVSTDLRITDGLDLTASERFRYSGENATTVGLRARWSDQSTVYIQQRATRRAENHGTETTTVVGGEERYGEEGNGRAYGEYHLDNGSSGQRTRAVLGFGQRWQIVDEFSLDLGFERSETLSSTSPDSEQARDTVSVGWELRLPDAIRVSGLFEARFDSGAARGAATGQCLGGAVDGTPGFCRDSVTSVGDRRQLASLLTAQWQITQDTSWFGRFDYVVTDNRTLDLVEARDIEGTLGMAWRPVDYDTVDLLARYTYLGELAPYGLELDQRREERSHVFSIAPIIELPWNFQLIEKVAYRNIRLDVEGMPRVNNDLWLFINRLNYHLLATVDIGAEYRFLHQTLTDDWEHGLLFEAAYILQENVRIGLGYNFTRFTEDELGDFDRNASGVFFRVTAQY